MSPWTVAHQASPCPWNFSGKDTGGGWHFLLQGIFLNQGLNPCHLHLLHRQVDSLPLCQLGSSDIDTGPSTASMTLWQRYTHSQPPALRPLPVYATWGLDILLETLSAVERVSVPLPTLGILSPSLKAILIVLLHSSSSSELRWILQARLIYFFCLFAWSLMGRQALSLSFFPNVWKVVITKIILATSFCEVNYFKSTTETEHLRRKWLRNWKENIILCYRWLEFGPFIFLLSNIRAIELRGRERPEQEIDGVWRRWGGRPAVILWILQWIHWNPVREASQGLENRLCLDDFQHTSQSSGKAQLSHTHFMLSWGKTLPVGLRVKEFQQVFIEILKHSLHIFLCH